MDCRWQQQNPYINLTPSVSSHKHISQFLAPESLKTLLFVWFGGGSNISPQTHYSLLKRYISLLQTLLCYSSLSFSPSMCVICINKLVFFFLYNNYLLLEHPWKLNMKTLLPQVGKYTRWPFQSFPFHMPKTNLERQYGKEMRNPHRIQSYLLNYMNNYFYYWFRI